MQEMQAMITSSATPKYYGYVVIPLFKLYCDIFKGGIKISEYLKDKMGAM